jgi:hypothetical protein
LIVGITPELCSSFCFYVDRPDEAARNRLVS